MALRLNLTAYNGTPVVVESDDGWVSVSIVAQAGETFDDADLFRQLLPAEARALAAALRHYADEAEAHR